MKFLDKDGQIVDGEPMTDEQVEQRELIVKYIHEKVCQGAYHSKVSRNYDKPSCETVANFLITKFQMTALDGVNLNREVELAVEENAPRAIEPPAPQPTPELTADEILF